MKMHKNNSFYKKLNSIKNEYEFFINSKRITRTFQSIKLDNKKIFNKFNYQLEGNRRYIKDN
ncbi:hypothetical protein HYE20_02250 [Mycoplasmopsis bovis]|nr:hypothetical protein [Mycoplasmopsis bovis]QQH24599.1 hypothetical protein HYE20_02250 [Mycoplasmopsis bovis]